jgi:hypothetical protein
VAGQPLGSGAKREGPTLLTGTTMPPGIGNRDGTKDSAHRTAARFFAPVRLSTGGTGAALRQVGGRLRFHDTGLDGGQKGFALSHSQSQRFHR